VRSECKITCNDTVCSNGLDACAALSRAAHRAEAERRAAKHSLDDDDDKTAAISAAVQVR
jgi:hypothetical protein